MLCILLQASSGEPYEGIHTHDEERTASLPTTGQHNRQAATEQSYKYHIRNTMKVQQIVRTLHLGQVSIAASSLHSCQPCSTLALRHTLPQLNVDSQRFWLHFREQNEERCLSFARRVYDFHNNCKTQHAFAAANCEDPRQGIFRWPDSRLVFCKSNVLAFEE